MLEPFLGRHPLPVALVLNVLLFAAVYASLTPHYVTTDDPAMTMQAAGVSMVDEASPILLFSHPWIGKILTVLYAWNLQVPWYGLYLVGTLFLAHTTLLFALLRNRPTLCALGGFLIYFVAVGVFLLINLQYTIVACLATGSGLVLLLAYPLDRRDGKACARWCWVPVLLAATMMIVLGGMIRWNGFRMAMAAIVIPGLCYRWGEPLGRMTLRLTAIAVAILLAGQVQKSDERMRAGVENAKYGEVASLRSTFNDCMVLESKPREQQEEIVRHVGWTLNDYDMLMQWFWMDEKVYSPEKMRAIFAELPRARDVRLSDVAELGGEILHNPGARSCLLLMVAFGILGWGAWSQLARLSCALGFFVVLMAYLWLSDRRPPERVYVPMLTVLAWLPLVFVDLKEALQPGKGLLHKMALFGVTLLLAVQAVQVVTCSVAESRRYAARHRELRATVARMSPHPADLYVIQGATFPWRWVTPFCDISFLRPFNSFNLWTDEHSPAAARRLQSRDIDNLYVALADKEHVFLLTRNNRFLDVYSQFVREHYDLLVTINPVFQAPWFTVYKPERER